MRLQSGYSPIAGALLTALAAGGCNPNPYCLNCDPRDLVISEGGADGPSDAGGTDDLPPVMPDLTGADGPCTPTNNGVEKCDKLDNDCNTKTDDVNPANLANDPNNCGACGKSCSYANAFGKCANAACTMGDCQPGYWDLDKDSKNGCEYACFPTPDPKEICDGKDNDCNGKIDDGFDLKNDPKNCGDCGNVCQFPGAEGKCEMGICKVTKCMDMFGDADKNPNNGCEYKCPIWPKVAETCNGKDDDCDGLVDNNVTDVGGMCDQACPPLAACVGNKNCAYKLSTCVGKCCGVCTQGMFICAGGQKVCQAGKGPSLEICNTFDDNCDGQVDEGFDVMNDPKNCGTCNNACSANNAVSGCAGGKCSILVCKPGFADLDKNPANGCEYTCPVNPATVESCDGKDNDCNGKADDGVTAPPNFCNQTGPCAGTKATCGGAKGWQCAYPMGVEVDANGNLALSEKLCDNIDGNCNTQVDESFVNKGKDCSAGSGACKVTGKFGCSMDKQSTTCSVAQGDQSKAVDEACNGADDDCDGTVDERTDGPGMCQNGGAHVCKGWRDPMIKMPNGKFIYAVEASRPDATANAVGTASSRACAKAGVQPWAPVNWDQARLACAAIVDSAGKAMRLCTADEWSQACAAASMATPIWSFGANPTTYQAKGCNGFDQGLGKAWVTGSGAQCYANLPDGKVFDLSGNVGEWTSTPVTAGGKTYYKVRGGAYNNFATGISCGFDFTIEQPGYQFSDLGFRCCADVAP